MNGMDLKDVSMWKKLASEARFRAKTHAKQLGVSRQYANRLSNVLFGMPHQAYLDALRLEAAPKVLVELRSVKLAADKLGFKQQSHFSKTFKAHHGQPPVDFLKACRATW
jgi:AraC-like DNA-binding protein